MQGVVCLWCVWCVLVCVNTVQDGLFSFDGDGEVGNRVRRASTRCAPDANLTAQVLHKFAVTIGSIRRFQWLRP